MKRYTWIIIAFLLQACHSESREDFLAISIVNPSEKWNGRNNQDYVKLWLNDSLIFDGTYFTQFNDTVPNAPKPFEEIKDFFGMSVAWLNKKEMNYHDSLKIRLRLITLDGMLDEDSFPPMDSIYFFYPIDSISQILFVVDKSNKEIRGLDYFHNPEIWEY